MTTLMVALAAFADPSGFACRQTVTFSGYSGEETLENFPVLVKLQSYRLKTEAGKDVVFTDASGYELPCELDSFTDTEALYWVGVPSLTKDTAITAWFGKEGYAYPAENVPRIWAKYAAVWHMNADAVDSTGHNLAQTTLATTTQVVEDNGLLGRGFQSQNKSNHDGVFFETPEAFIRQHFGGQQNLQITVSGWVMPAVQNPSKAGRIFAWKSDTNKAGIDVFQNTNGKLYLRGDDKSKSYISNDSLFTAAGGWHHLATCFDGATFNAYLDGDELAFTGSTSAATVGAYGNITQFGFGNLAPGSDYSHNAEFQYPFAGQFDEFRLYDGVASADWVKAEWATVNAADFAVYGEVTDPEGNPLRTVCVWTSTDSSTDWSDPANWQGGNLPVAFTDSVRFASEGLTEQTIVLPSSGVVRTADITQDDGVARVLRGGSLAVAANAALTVAAGSSLELAVPVAAGAWTKSGTGALVVAAPLTTTYGGFAVDAGTVAFTSAGSVIDGALDIAADATVTVAVDLNVKGLSGAGALVGASAVTLTIENSEAATFRGTVAGDGFSLVKDGPALQILGGEQVFTGGIHVRNGELRLASAASLHSGTPVTFGDDTGRNQRGLLTFEGSDTVFTNPIHVRKMDTGYSDLGFGARNGQSVTLRDSAVVVDGSANAGQNAKDGQFAIQACDEKGGEGPSTVGLKDVTMPYLDFVVRLDGREDLAEDVRSANRAVIDNLTGSDSRGIRKLSVLNSLPNRLGGTLDFVGGNAVMIDYLDFVGHQTKVNVRDGVTLTAKHVRLASSVKDIIGDECDVDLTISEGAMLIANGFPSEARNYYTKKTTSKDTVLRLDGGTFRVYDTGNRESVDLSAPFEDFAVRTEVGANGGMIDLNPVNGAAVPMTVITPISGTGRLTFRGDETVPAVTLAGAYSSTGALVADAVNLTFAAPAADGTAVTLTNRGAVSVAGAAEAEPLSVRLASLASEEPAVVSVSEGDTLTVASLASAKSVTKKGAGEFVIALTEDTCAADGNQLTVENGTLTLRAPISVTEVTVVTDGDFEPRENALAVNNQPANNDPSKGDKRSTRDATFLQNEFPTWTFESADNNGSGICCNGSYFSNNSQIGNAGLDGNQHCAFLRIDKGSDKNVGPGRLSRTILAPAANTEFTVSYLATARHYQTQNFFGRIKLQLDGVDIENSPTDVLLTASMWNVWTPFVVTFTVPTPGEHTLSFVAVGKDLDNASSSCDVLLDHVQIGYSHPSEDTPDLRGMRIELKDGAKLRLDLHSSQTCEIGALIVDGQKWRGVLDAGTCPAIEGTGHLKVKTGLAIIVR